MPPARAYAPPSPPGPRELGPAPPGYGRYADYDRATGTAGPPLPSFHGAPRRNLDEVLCFKVCELPCAFRLLLTVPFQCGEKGHYANHCPNRVRPTL